MELTRYMSIEKYRDLLSTETLFLPRYDNLGDQYEGCLGHIPIDKLIEKQRNRFGRITTMPLQTETLAREFLETFEPLLYHNFLREFTFVSCWHKNEKESMPMWKMYAEKGIMIKSELSLLRSSLGIDTEDYLHSDAFQKNQGIDPTYGYEVFIKSDNVGYISRGNYIEPIGADRYFYKQLEYADERELRVILQFHLGPKLRFNFPYMFDNIDSALQNIINGDFPYLFSNSDWSSQNITNQEEIFHESNIRIYSELEQIYDFPVTLNSVDFSPQSITNRKSTILDFWNIAKSSYEKHALLLNEGLTESGVRCPVNTCSLIKEVVTSPFNSTDSEVREIESLNEEFGITAEVKKSVIEIEPIHAKFSMHLPDEEMIELEL